MTRMKGQSVEARLARLADGCCPIHGLGMSQVSVFYDDRSPERRDMDWHNCDLIGGRIRDKRRQYCYVECPRRDCSIVAKAWPPADGGDPFAMPCTLTRPFAHLVRRKKAGPTT